MSDYPVLSIDEQHRRLLSMRRAIMPGADVTEGGVFWRDDRVVAAGLTDAHAHILAVDRDSVPITAESSALDRWGQLVGVGRKGATTAARSAALLVTGTPAVNVPALATLLDTVTAIRVEVVSAAVIGADGTVLVDVQSIDTGEAANLPVGSILAFESAIVGANDTATLVLALQGGTNAEQDGATRARVTNRFAETPQGGNRNDWTQWCLLVAGVDAAYALSVRNGIGTVDIVGLRNLTGPARSLDAPKRAEVAAVIDALKPLGSAFRVLETTAEVVDATIEIRPLNLSAYRFDWDDSAGVVVASYDAGTRVVTTEDALPSSFGAGARLVFGDDGGVFLAAAVVGADAFILATTTPEQASYAPSAAVAIYAGGPLTALIRDVVLNGYLAPNGSRIPGINNLGPANPDGVYGAWIDAVERPRLIAAALAIPGVYRATVPALAVDDVAVEGDIASPSDPAEPGALPEETESIGLLVAGTIIVREAHA